MPEPSLKEGRDVAGEEGESSPSGFVTFFIGRSHLLPNQERSRVGSKGCGWRLLGAEYSCPHLPHQIKWGLVLKSSPPVWWWQEVRALGGVWSRGWDPHKRDRRSYETAPREPPCRFHQGRAQREGAVPGPGRGLHQTPNLPAPATTCHQTRPDFSLWTVREKRLPFKPPGLRYFRCSSSS